MLPSIEGGAIIGKVWAEASQGACVLSVAKAGSGLVVQQHLVVGYKACTSYMQLLLPYYHNTSTANY